MRSSSTCENSSLTSDSSSVDFTLLSLHSVNSRIEAQIIPRQIMPKDTPYPVGYEGASASRKMFVPMIPGQTSDGLLAAQIVTFQLTSKVASGEQPCQTN